MRSVSTAAPPKATARRSSTASASWSTRRFKIDNPNASGSCGCGHSFQVADGDRLDGSAVQNAGCSH